MEVLADPPAFVGRDRELSVLAGHLALARAGRSQVVVVEGDPGSGKTALVQAFLDGLDPNTGVLRASGEEAEELVSYGVVEQLARAVDRVGDAGPAVEVRPADEPPVVGAVLVALLDRLRDRGGPVVVVVDDGHWADVPSVQALVFALRRLGSDRVLTLVAARPHDGGRIDRLRGLASGDRGRTLRLGGLGVDGLVALGRALGAGELPPPAAQRLLAHTGGVPLHARALFEEVDPALLRSMEGPLPSPMSYAVLVLGRLSQCPPGARAVVAAAAVLGERSRLTDAVDLAGETGAEVVAPAVTAKLVTIGPAPDGTALRFPHALIRAAVYHDLDLADRMALHARAARIVDAPDEVLRHRVAAAGGSDRGLADELRALAGEQVERGERSRAAATLISAAGLYPDAADRTRGLLDAVELLVLAGERSRATELARAVPGGRSAHERFVRGLLAFTAGRTSEAEQLLLAAWAVADDTDPGFRAGVCDALCHLYYLQLRTTESVEWGNRALAVDPRQSVSLVTSLALAGRSIAPTAELATAVARGARLLWTEDHAGARTELAGAVTALRAGGMFVASLHAQGYLALTQHRMGAWDGAVADATEAVALAEDAEQDWMLARLHSYAAMPHAARGEWDRADAHVAAATAAAAATGLPLDRVGATVAAANVADARGAHTRVVELLGPLAERAAGRAGEPGVSNWPCMLADALVHLGRPDDADRVLAPFERRAAELGRRVALTAAGRVRGRVLATRGDVIGAERALRDAADHARGAGAEIDVALTALTHGALLRRSGRRRAAADALGAARAVLDRLGARPALERCDEELAACGLTPTRRTAREPGALTPRELCVARLAASGMSNPEVAAELIVSLNTVEFHLRNVYAKFGIRSRAQLRGALRGADDG
ncbi:helix-turn-helix transcriptional regulator [Pseudonocardia abyssalis]|uniref:AAA family ATPase n=1 Tax=Pseudonocardia abyssalis TaxID=2792008 RepID=A0ABS6UMG0_9PSEU|nr:LuxR family transcriptional regulator [Pseudonocardia abyssalis]MBW0114621.1 AAA family ATPase [Pseudonocardia abyssalis]MBW0132989.1 AAA family ATPase [Pseudonocardia abyssalis]